LEVALFWREGEVDAVARDGLGPDWSSGCHGEEMVTWLGVRAKNVETRNGQEETEILKKVFVLDGVKVGMLSLVRCDAIFKGATGGSRNVIGGRALKRNVSHLSKHSNV
jgi:hypothetical protein